LYKHTAGNIKKRERLLSKFFRCLFCQHIEVKIITGGNHTQLTVRFLKVGDGKRERLLSKFFGCLFCQHIEVKIITGENHTQLTVRFLKVGDGINDAPSLAFADVGIAIQNEAQENVASDVASIVLLGNRLSQVRFAFLIKFLKLISFC
jgi:transcription elongation factor Elf1